MPELPEIAVLARQMNKKLVGKTLTRIEVRQPKCLNVSKSVFVKALVGARIVGVTQRGKWLLAETTQGWLLLNLGMGGEILLVTRDTLPSKHRLIFDLDSGECLAINFWWFGYAHYARPGKLDKHAMLAKLGPNALDVTLDGLQAMLKGRRGQLKSFLLDQSKLGGIGNFYIHDILFLARLHPLRLIHTLTEAEVKALFEAIHTGLQTAIDKSGSSYEVDLYGRKGHWTADDILVGYREGKPCPACGTSIIKIRTGSTSSFICARCQPLAC